MGLTWQCGLVVTFTAVMIGCEEKPGPPACHEDADCLEGLICKPHVCPDQYACLPPAEGDLDDYRSRCVVDGRCDEARCESCLSCPEDCCPTCDVAGLVATPPLDFLVSSYRMVSKNDAPHAYGLDLDGDDEADNRLGSIIHISWDPETDPDPNLALDARLRDGESLVVLRLHAPSLTEDSTEVLVQPLLAEVLDATPTFLGRDTVALSADASRDAYVCGSLYDQRLVSQPAPTDLRFPIPYDVNAGRLTPLRVRRVRLELVVSPQGLTQIWIGGGIPTEEIAGVLWPRLAEVLTRQARANGWSHASSINGCPYPIPGCSEGPDCAIEDPPVITVAEIRCDSMLVQAFAPDLDLDHDGINDALSFAFKLAAVPVTLVD